MKLFVFVLAVIPAIAFSQQTCTNGRVYETCGTACPLTCDNYMNPPFICPAVCVQGCFCPSGSGLVQLGDRCVPTSECAGTSTPLPSTPPPTPPPTTVSTPTCTNGRVYETCGTACPLTCDNYRNPPAFCTFQCVQGCFCPSGLVALGDRCVQETDCPVPTPAPPPTCTNGMIFNSCGTACPLTCEHPHPRPCTRQCVQGCFCPQGMLQDGDRCVAPTDCPATTTTDTATVTAATTTTTTPAPPTRPTCASGMIFETCGTACPLTCEHPNPRPCTRQCVQGCFCPQGLLQDGDRCVALSDCPAPTPEPPTPVCQNGMVHTTCGSACPLTCENRFLPPAPCPLICVQGCFCPSGMAEHDGRCYRPEDCPATGTAATTTATTTTAVTVMPTTPTCPASMLFTTCGSSCPTTCENYGRPIPCSFVCFRGCVCPPHTVLHNDRCIRFEDCPPRTTTQVTTTATPPPTCTNGKEYRECGPVCRPTCIGLNACFSLRCVSGCFCPEGQFEHEGGCVDVCPDNNTPPPPTTDVTTTETTTVGGALPCSAIRCPPHQFCENAQCVDYTCENYPYCREDQQCVMVPHDCNPEDRTCSGMRPRCMDAPYVPCGHDAFLACDSEWTYCLQQNKTRRAECVASCLSRNGNCGERTCVTTPGERPRLQCLADEDLSSECNPGMVMNNCGNLCQLTCEQQVSGAPRICPRICGPAECGCPRGLALFRDRCVDPKLCYVLVNYPPAIHPLPRVDPNTVLLSLHSPEMSHDMFMANRMELLQDIESILQSQGFDVNAAIHGVHFQDGQLQIVVEVAGDDIHPETLADALREQAHLLSVDVQSIGHVEIDLIEPSDDDDDDDDREEHKEAELSRGAIIAIAVSSGAVGMAVVLTWIAIVMCCCMARGSNRSPPQSPHAKENDYAMSSAFPAIVVTDKRGTINPEKEKMLKESLY